MLNGIMKNYRLSQVGGNLGCFFKKKILIGAHVDDLLTIGSKKELDQIKKEIQQHVELNMSRTPTKMLRMEMTCNDKGISLTQWGLIETPGI